MSKTVRINNADDLVAVAPEYGIEIKPAGAKPKRPLAAAIKAAGDVIEDTLYFHNGFAKGTVAKKTAPDSYRVAFQINVSETDVPVFADGVQVKTYTSGELRQAAGKSGTGRVSMSNVPAALAVLLSVPVERVNVVSVENIGKPTATPVVPVVVATADADKPVEPSSVPAVESNDVPVVPGTDEPASTVKTVVEPVAVKPAAPKRTRKPAAKEAVAV